ncbi:MAG: hypothetical protein PHV23_01180 [Candidatus Gracilibacteria bacterium]|nr:hypothetical protein [Candidatus Gracilibacteria bacterium]
MKKIFLLIIMIFVLVSCGEDFKEAGTITSDYVDTLQDTVVDAKDIKVMMEAGQGDMQKQIDAVKN